MIALCTSPRFADHLTGPHHPERPDRIRAIFKAVRDAGLVDSPNPFPGFSMNFGLHPLGLPKLLELSPAPADLRWVQTVHPPDMIQRIERICLHGGGVLDQGDTPVGPDSYQIALLAAGAAMGCADAVLHGRARRAFAAIRPPGHHAEPQRPMGFCLFNNVAITARYLQQAYGIGRIAIVDFDVHHGNGTQAAFDDDPDVLFISLHQNPRTCYPGSGHDWEIGHARARGYTINIPFDPGAEDIDYLRVIDSRVVPELEEFRPQVLLISAGFDAHQDDPLADINLSDDGFEQMTRALVAVADRYCDGRVISLLEGGYNLRVLGRCVVRHLVGLRA
jgi:acetoin utilization deacetylase AcuC-like enzyme